jgi:hypothetical protein
MLLCPGGAGAAELPDLSELRTLFGITVGRAATPPGNLTSLERRGRCLCPDFCRRDLPELAGGAHLSSRWALRAGVCRADLVTAEASPLSLQRLPNAEPAMTVFGLSRAEIEARYGRPSKSSVVAGGQLTYCDALPDEPPPTVGFDLIFYSFLLANDRVTAIRVGTTGYCPDHAFLPVP